MKNLKSIIVVVLILVVFFFFIVYCIYFYVEDGYIYVYDGIVYMYDYGVGIYIYGYGGDGYSYFNVDGSLVFCYLVMNGEFWMNFNDFLMENDLCNFSCFVLKISEDKGLFFCMVFYVYDDME